MGARRPCVRLWEMTIYVRRPRDGGGRRPAREAIQILDDKYVVELSLDHDLGGEDTTRPIVLWMCETRIWPGTIRVHSVVNWSASNGLSG